MTYTRWSPSSNFPARLTICESLHCKGSPAPLDHHHPGCTGHVGCSHHLVDLMVQAGVCSAELSSPALPHALSHAGTTRAQRTLGQGCQSLSWAQALTWWRGRHLPGACACSAVRQMSGCCWIQSPAGGHALCHVEERHMLWLLSTQATNSKTGTRRQLQREPSSACTQIMTVKRHVVGCCRVRTSEQTTDSKVDGSITTATENGTRGHAIEVSHQQDQLFRGLGCQSCITTSRMMRLLITSMVQCSQVQVVHRQTCCMRLRLS